jgi:peptidoglycan-associated lipoprotein
MTAMFRSLTTLAALAAVTAGFGCGSSMAQQTARPELTSTARITRTPNPAGELARCELAPIYFGFDSSDLSEQARRDLQANVSCAKDREAAQLRITGMTDPRGTEEYNLALGDRRAISVKRYVTALGLEEDQVSTHSTGEEFSRGADEPGWAQDRRANFE